MFAARKVFATPITREFCRNLLCYCMPMVLHRNAITRPRCEISGPPLLSFEQVHSAPVNSDPCIHPSQSQSHAHVQSAFRRTPSILTQNTSSSRQAAARHLPDPARAMNEARAHPESHRMSRKAQQRDRGTHESDTVLPFSIDQVQVAVTLPPGLRAPPRR